MTSKRICQRCKYFTHYYLSELTFLYRCVDNIALTTNELKEECVYKGDGV